jgi:ribonuclease HI
MIVYVDGLCEPKNPGGTATYGFAVYSNNRKLVAEAGVTGAGPSMSNNVAEYSALCEALKWLGKHDLQHENVIVKSDSRLLVNQMSGRWKTRRGFYLNKFLEARKLASAFLKISFFWVPREENTEADELSRRAYQEYLKAKRTR